MLHNFSYVKLICNNFNYKFILKKNIIDKNYIISDKIHNKKVFNDNKLTLGDKI